MAEKKTGARPPRAKAGTRAAGSNKTEAGGKLKGKPDREGKAMQGAAAGEPGAIPGRRKRTAESRRRSTGTTTARQGMGPQVDAILEQLRDVRALLEQLAVPPRNSNEITADPMLEGAVDSLRRLVSELIEARLEAIVRDLVDIRREAAGALGDAGGLAVERVDQLLESLGAVKFEGQRFDAVDPLIHMMVEERQEEGVPDGVILAGVRPGFRSGRGMVVCKAAVAVNRRA